MPKPNFLRAPGFRRPSGGGVLVVASSVFAVVYGDVMCCDVIWYDSR